MDSFDIEDDFMTDYLQTAADPCNLDAVESRNEFAAMPSNHFATDPANGLAAEPCQSEVEATAEWWDECLRELENRQPGLEEDSSVTSDTSYFMAASTEDTSSFMSSPTESTSSFMTAPTEDTVPMLEDIPLYLPLNPSNCPSAVVPAPMPTPVPAPISAVEPASVPRSMAQPTQSKQARAAAKRLQRRASNADDPARTRRLDQNKAAAAKCRARKAEALAAAESKAETFEKRAITAEESLKQALKELHELRTVLALYEQPECLR